MKIAIISHYYPPEPGAPQARLSEMARTWVELGHDVRVVTCYPNHPNGIVPPDYQQSYRSRRSSDEPLDGVRVRRCWAYATPNKGFVRKLVGHLTFMLTAVFQGKPAVRDADCIIVSSPTLFSVVSAWLLSRRYGIPFVFEVRDLWPAIFVELGVLKNRFLIWTLERLEMFLYRQAALVVPVTKRFAEDIVRRGIPGAKVKVITNGVDLRKFTPRTRPVELADELGLTGKFVVLYIGAHGISHSLTKIVDAALELRDRPDIVFLFVGDGSEKEKVQQYAAANNATNCRFIESQPKERVALFYALADVCLVPLRNISLFDTFIPSKMFEVMAMARPIIASVRGEAAEILQASGGALIGEPEDFAAIARHVSDLHKDRTLAAALGEKGREFAEQHYDRRCLAERYESMLRDLVPRSPDNSGTDAKSVGADEALPASSTGSGFAVKRGLDILMSLLGAVCLFIPLTVIALAVKLTSRGPILYWSDRVGRENRLFRMPKFRTMRTDTPQLASHLLANAEQWMTPMGGVLRKFSLDELPQIWSVLKGDMSVVGPRPALYNQHDLVEIRTELGVQRLTPGLTGWAQINGRDELPIAVKAKLDEYYLNNWSPWFDFKIILLTIWKSLRGESTKVPEGLLGARATSEMCHALLESGRTLHERGEFARAVDDFSQAIRLSPTHLEAHLARSEAFASMGEYDRSISDLSRVIELDPSSAVGHFRRARAWSLLGEHSRADTDHEIASQLDPKFASLGRFEAGGRFARSARTGVTERIDSYRATGEV